MSTQPTNNNSNLYSSYLSEEEVCELSEGDENYCNYLRRKVDWSMSSTSYRRAKPGTRECFKRSTYYQRERVVQCWKQCDLTGPNTACYWNVKQQNCYFFANPDLGDFERSSMTFHVT